MGEVNSILAILIVLMIITCIFIIIAGILQIIGQWNFFKKAQKPGWAAVVPIYNIFVLLEIIKMDWWHLLIYVALEVLMFIEVEFISLIGSIGVLVYFFIFNIKLAKIFGKSTGFGVMTTFFPFVGYMILGLGKAKYQG